MEYSTKNFLEAAASDTEADPNFLRFIADTATREKDIKVLTALARNASTPQDVLDTLLDKAQAPVKVAVLTRPTTSNETILAWSSDRRIGVGAAVAATPGLPYEAYQTVLKTHSNAKVALEALKNVDLPRDLVATAIVRSIAGMSKLSYRKTYEAYTLIEKHMSASTTTQHEVLDSLVETTAVPGQLLKVLVDSADLSSDQLEKLARLTYASFARYGVGGGNYQTSSWDICLRFLTMEGTPAWLEPKMHQLVLEEEERTKNQRWRRSILHSWDSYFSSHAKGQSPRPTREERVEPEDQGEATREVKLEAALSGILDPFDRLALARTLGEMTDEEYVAIVNGSNNGWMWDDPLNPSELSGVKRNDALHFFESAKGSPVKVAALLCATSTRYIPAEVLDSVSVEDVFNAHRRNRAGSLNYLTFQRSADNWVEMLRRRGFTVADLEYIPADLFNQQGFGAAWPAQMSDECSTWLAQATARAVWESVGNNPTSWDVFAQMSSVEGVSVAEALASTGDIAV